MATPPYSNNKNDFPIFSGADEESVRKLSYAFKYRDLSKEALMMIAEALMLNKI